MRPGAHLQRAGVRGAPFWTRFVFCNVLEGGALRSLVTPFCTEVTQQSKHLGTAYAWGQGVLRALVRVHQVDCFGASRGGDQLQTSAVPISWPWTLKVSCLRGTPKNVSTWGSEARAQHWECGLSERRSSPSSWCLPLCHSLVSGLLRSVGGVCRSRGCRGGGKSGNGCRG